MRSTTQVLVGRQARWELTVTGVVPIARVTIGALSRRCGGAPVAGR
ncbi:MAG: hypothetical protein WB565_09135 [Acidimicrobiales bacterium]